MKQVAGRLRIDLAQYGEMARFVKFGAEVDETTQLQLTRGERARELLRQAQHAPMTLEEEVVVLYAVVNGRFDDVAVSDVGEAETRLLDYVTRVRPEVLQQVAQARGLTEEIEALLSDVLDGFGAQVPTPAESAGVPMHEAVL